MQKPDYSFFDKLKLIFSTNAITAINSRGERKVIDTERRQEVSNLTGRFVDRYTRLHRGQYDGQQYGVAMSYHQNRLMLFRDYDAMDTDPILSSALDIYADECTTKDEYGDILQIKSSNSAVKDSLYNLFYDILNIEFNLWPWTRNLTKYGDFFLGLEIKEGQGIVNAHPQSVYYTERLEGADPDNPDYVKFKVEMDRFGKREWENFEMAHFRLLADTNFLPYGKCLPNTAFVATETGSQTIDTLVPGQRVWVWNGTSLELSPIKHVVSSGKKQIIEISTPRRALQSSLNHPILTWNTTSASSEYKLAEDIKLGDLLVVSTGVRDDANNIFDLYVVGDDTFVTTEPVIDLKMLDEQDTYDIQVESEHSNFIANGVVVHNSMIENGRKVWKQLILMEDAMLIHRIMRAPEKRVFRIDIGNINPTEVDNYMQKIINKMKKVPVVDRQTGDYNLRYNMQNLTEDFYLPVRGSDSGTNIDSLNGLEYSAIEDIEYLLAKLFASLKIPKAYLSYDESINGKATLAAEDIRFARTIERIQRTIVSELNKIAIVHLVASGFTVDEIADYELSLTNPSTIYEQEKISLWSDKMSLANDIKDSNLLSIDWIYSNIFNFTLDEADIERAKILTDLKLKQRYSSIENDGKDPFADEASAIKPKDDGPDYTPPENLGGRPKEVMSYRSDEHPRGRDPVGDKERRAPRARESVNKTSDVIKIIDQLKASSKLKSKKTLINEESIPTSSILDENNILDVEI
jgi:hypothetical protein